MSKVDTFFVVVIGMTSLSVLLSFFVFYSGIRFPRKHPERGLHYFNSVVLLLLASVIFLGGTYLQNRNRKFEMVVDVYPTARYAPWKNALLPNHTWVYLSQDSPLQIEEYYHKEAKVTGSTISVDHKRSAVVLLLSEAPKLFLTIQNEDGESVLSYSNEGEKSISLDPH